MVPIRLEPLLLMQPMARSLLLLFFIIRCDKVGGVSGIVEYAKSESGLPHLNGSQWVSLMATVLMTSFGTWGLPQMVQKYFGIKDDKQAKRGITISTFFAFLVAGGGYFIGSLCHRYYTDIIQSASICRRRIT